jgi:hypothetical protein
MIWPGDTYIFTYTMITKNLAIFDYEASGGSGKKERLKVCKEMAFQGIKDFSA